MHLFLILTALSLAISLRLISPKTNSKLEKNWSYNLFLFSFPPLLLITTSLAIIFMGYQGEMLGFPASKFSYIIAGMFAILSIFSLIKLAYQAHSSLEKIKTYPLQSIQNTQARIVNFPFPFAGQIGFWKPELVITNELIKMLSPQHLEAVIAHEEAHYNHRDTFCFFWLGFLKSTTSWLPNTENLWNQLLLLRELRADKKASEKVDFLLLAESLLLVTQACLESSNDLQDEFVCAFSNQRLTERIDALLNPCQSSSCSSNMPSWSWLLLTLLPWLTIPLHY